MRVFPRVSTRPYVGDATSESALDRLHEALKTENTLSAPYLFPMDESEKRRLGLEHQILRATFQRNALAPIGSPGSVLDVGCGIGHWTMEMAQSLPDSYVLGLDLTLPDTDTLDFSQSQAPRRPNNCTFITADALKELPFANESFAYTHMRLLYLGIPTASWSHVLNEVVRVTRPHGWVELVEGGLARGGGPALDLMMGWIHQLAQRRGIDTRMGRQIGAGLRERSLRNIVSHEAELPIGDHAGRLGSMMAANFFAQLEALRPQLVKEGVTSEALFDQALFEMRVEMARWSYVQPLYIAFGQR